MQLNKNNSNIPNFNIPSFSTTSHNVDKNNILTHYDVGNDFYEKLFDADYFIFIHNLIINEIIKKYPTAINITFFDNFSHPTFHNFEEVFLNNKGNMNHLNEVGNNLIYKKVKNILKIE
jgi:hypothetical protein